MSLWHLLARNGAFGLCWQPAVFLYHVFRQGSNILLQPPIKTHSTCRPILHLVGQLWSSAEPTPDSWHFQRPPNQGEGGGSQAGASLCPLGPRVSTAPLPSCSLGSDGQPWGLLRGTRRMRGVLIGMGGGSSAVREIWIVGGTWVPALGCHELPTVLRVSLPLAS